MLDDNKTVFHLVDGDSDDQELTLTLAENLTEDDTIDMDDVAILAQAEGIDPVTEEGDQSDHVRSLVEDGVSVKACSNTLAMFASTSPTSSMASRPSRRASANSRGSRTTATPTLARNRAYSTAGSD